LTYDRSTTAGGTGQLEPRQHDAGRERRACRSDRTRRVGLCEIVHRTCRFRRRGGVRDAEGRVIEWHRSLHEQLGTTRRSGTALPEAPTERRVHRAAAESIGRVSRSVGTLGGQRTAGHASGTLPAAPLGRAGPACHRDVRRQPIGACTPRAAEERGRGPPLRPAWAAGGGFRAFDTRRIRAWAGRSTARRVPGRAPPRRGLLSTKVGRLLVPAAGDVEGRDGFLRNARAGARLREYSRGACWPPWEGSLERLGHDPVSTSSSFTHPDEPPGKALDEASRHGRAACGLVWSARSGFGMEPGARCGWFLPRRRLECC